MSQNQLQSVESRLAGTWSSPPGLSGWIATVNNRPVGERYMITALSFFSAGVILAVLMRTQLAVPENNLLSPETYNGIFTMHGSTMLYLFAVPFVEGLGLYLVPMLVGSRDVAFPRLSSLGYWLYLFGGLTIYSSVLFGAVPDAGWTAYTPLSGPRHSGIGLDFWLLGLSMIEIAGIGAAVEIVATILKFRAPGMAVQHVPILIWAYLVTGMMIIFAFTPLLLATLMLEMERTFGFQFFNPLLGGSSLLWQHLFWWFGHPEVYIIFLPATGIISEIVPVFTRRRLVAHPFVIAALVITGFVSFGLWSHHMFVTGIPHLPMHFFTAASFMIALASGVQVFAWIATVWGSRPPFNVQILYILGFFFIFVNGGLTGVMVATMTFDFQVHETNFVVAHFHHVLIGGAVLPFIAGLHHWLPKVSGRMFSEIWGKIAFAFVFLGFNFTFIPMYIIGFFGMRRRVYTFPEELGVGTLNLISTIGAYALAAGFGLTLLNLLWHSRWGRKASGDPWKAGSLEWSTSSPPPPYGFGRSPVVRDLYPRWQENPSGPSSDAYTERLNAVAEALEFRPSGWRATLLTDVANGFPQAVQYIPGPTHLPFLIAVAILLAAVSLLAKSFITAAVAALLVIGLIGRWLTLEPDLPEEEARLISSRLDLPLRGSGRQAIGWWGMLGMVAVLFTVFGALAFSYFYLRLYSDQWPQAGLPVPDLTLPFLAFLVLAAGGVVQLFSMWARNRGRVRSLAFSIFVAAILGLGFLGIELGDLIATPFPPTLNAYGSIFFTINGFSLLMVLVAVSLQIGTLLRMLVRGEPPEEPRLRLWLQNTEIFWFFAVAVGIGGMVVTYVVPHVL
jgi:cytochrome c oxidase subunit I+III